MGHIRLINEDIKHKLHNQSAQGEVHGLF